MNNDNSNAIVFLLAAILCVLLFGSSAVLSGIGWIAGIGAVLAVIFFVIAGIARFFGEVRDEIVTARTERKPWLHLLVLWPGIIGNFAVGGLAALRWMDGDIRFGDALETVPYWWVPVTVMFAGMVVQAIESAHEWLPKVPGGIASFLRGWLTLAIAPVAGPVGRWQTIRAQRARGEPVGVIYAGLSVLGTFALSLLFWIPFVFLPLVVGAAETISRFR